MSYLWPDVCVCAYVCVAHDSPASCALDCSLCRGRCRSCWSGRRRWRAQGDQSGVWVDAPVAIAWLSLDRRLKTRCLTPRDRQCTWKSEARQVNRCKHWKESSEHMKNEWRVACYWKPLLSPVSITLTDLKVSHALYMYRWITHPQSDESPRGSRSYQHATLH